jgi:dihydroneopterin triphosphate diphosphatase
MPEFVSNTIQLHVVKKEGDKYKFLVLQRADDVYPYPGLWQVITGTMRGGETAKETALRELEEETGLKPLKFWTLPYLTTFFDAETDRVNASPVFATWVETDKEVIISSEHKDYKWCDYEECIRILELPSHKEGTRIFYEFILMSKKIFMKDLLR